MTDEEFCTQVENAKLSPEEEEAMETDTTKYVTPLLNVDSQSVVVDDAASTEDKKYVFISYSLKDVQNEVSLTLSECDLAGSIDTATHNTLGAIDLPEAKNVEKKTFRAADGKEIQISPISLTVANENVESYYEAARNAIIPC